MPDGRVLVESPEGIPSVAVQLHEAEVAGVFGGGVRTRQEGPVLEWPQGSRNEAITCLSGVVTGEGDDIFRLHNGGGVLH